MIKTNFHFPSLFHTFPPAVFFRTKVYLNGVNDNHVVTRESKRKMFLHDSVVRQI